MPSRSLQEGSGGRSGEVNRTRERRRPAPARNRVCQLLTEAGRGSGAPFVSRSELCTRGESRPCPLHGTHDRVHAGDVPIGRDRLGGGGVGTCR